METKLAHMLPPSYTHDGETYLQFKHNFLEQSYLKETDKDATLKHFKFKTLHQDENSVILSKRGPSKPLFTVADL